MSELIKREDAIKITWQEPQYYDPINALTEVREKIRALPTVDAVPVRHGEWIKKERYGFLCSFCSNLFVLYGVDDLKSYHYCPNCGAKMDGGKADAEK